MTKMLDQAIEKIRQLPAAEQDEAAEMLLCLVSRYAAPTKLDDASRAAIRERSKQARRGEFASDEAMAALFKRRKG